MTETKPESERCAVCAWPLTGELERGCVRGDCSLRPLPPFAFEPERANREYEGRRYWQPDEPSVEPQGYHSKSEMKRVNTMKGLPMDTPKAVEPQGAGKWPVRLEFMSPETALGNVRQFVHGHACDSPYHAPTCIQVDIVAERIRALAAEIAELQRIINDLPHEETLRLMKERDAVRDENASLAEALEKARDWMKLSDEAMTLATAIRHAKRAISVITDALRKREKETDQ